jgi:hypothetical protein
MNKSIVTEKRIITIGRRRNHHSHVADAASVGEPSMRPTVQGI